MSSEETFRIVGVRVDGSKRILCDKIASVEIAKRVSGELSQTDVFVRVVVESEAEPLFEPNLSWRMELRE